MPVCPLQSPSFSSCLPNAQLHLCIPIFSLVEAGSALGHAPSQGKRIGDGRGNGCKSYTKAWSECGTLADVTYLSHGLSPVYGKLKNLEWDWSPVSPRPADLSPGAQPLTSPSDAQDFAWQLFQLFARSWALFLFVGMETIFTYLSTLLGSLLMKQIKAFARL